MCSREYCKDKRIKVRPVPGWDNYYVTSNGEVYRVQRLTPLKNAKGYLRVRLNNGQRRILQFIHRIVVSAFDKRRELNPETETVDHNDGIKDHNCRHNLEAVTNAVNNHRKYNGYDKEQFDITKSLPGDPF